VISVLSASQCTVFQTDSIYQVLESWSVYRGATGNHCLTTGLNAAAGSVVLVASGHYLVSVSTTRQLIKSFTARRVVKIPGSDLQGKSIRGALLPVLAN